MKGLEGKFNYSLSLRSRSRRVTKETSMTVVDSMRHSCWSDLPTELLRDVLMRIEESEAMWPLRKNVVACAGVCKSWREIMKEIVKTLEVSEKLTFPISLKQPGPRNAVVRCFIRRSSSSKTSKTYSLYLNLSQGFNDAGKFLLCAQRCKRPTYTEYIISLNSEDVSKESGNYIGKLRSNFFATKFTICDAQSSNTGTKLTKFSSARFVGMKQVSPGIPDGNYPLAHVSYELNVMGTRGPRRMLCVMPDPAIGAQGVAPTQTEFLPDNLDIVPLHPLSRSKSTRMNIFRSSRHLATKKDKKMLVLKNKIPVWHEQLQCWSLNFNGRVTVASVKNFQLVASIENGQEQGDVILQFGKVGNDVFTMDYRYPVSAFQAFAICLSSFDTKIGCE